jgi:hypothetical protein
MPCRSAVLALCLLAALAGPAAAGGAAEKACILAMVERLPRLPGLRVTGSELTPWPIVTPRPVPLGMRRQVLRGRLGVEAVGLEASYALVCSLLLDSQGRVRIEEEESSIALVG